MFGFSGWEIEMRHDSLDLATTITAPTNAADDKVYRDTTTTSLEKRIIIIVIWGT